MAKKYYWLKLTEDFFTKPKIKKLRKIAGGDTYTIIYLKLQLLSLKNEGTLFFEGIEDNFIEELALNIDEDVDNIKFTVLYLINQKLLEEVESDEFSLPETKAAIGKESESAPRVRKLREKRKEEKSLQCNMPVTLCNTEIEIEIEKELEIKKDIKKKREYFIIPSLEEITLYCSERKNSVDPEKFSDFYTSKGWFVGKNKMKDWKSAVRNWERNNKKTDSKIFGKGKETEYFNTIGKW